MSVIAVQGPATSTIQSNWLLTHAEFLRFYYTTPLHTLLQEEVQSLLQKLQAATTEAAEQLGRAQATAAGEAAAAAQRTQQREARMATRLQELEQEQAELRNHM